MHARPEQIQDFRLEEMAAEIARTAPKLWSLVRTLLGGLDTQEEEVPACEESAGEADVDDEALWNMVGNLPGEEGLKTDGSGARLGKKALRRLRELRQALIDIVCGVYMQYMPPTLD